MGCNRHFSQRKWGGVEPSKPIALQDIAGVALFLRNGRVAVVNCDGETIPTALRAEPLSKGAFDRCVGDGGAAE